MLHSIDVTITILYTGGEIIPPVVQHLNVDSIEMQPSPAYVPFSQDNKISSTVAEYEIPIVQPPVNKQQL